MGIEPTTSRLTGTLCALAPRLASKNYNKLIINQPCLDGKTAAFLQGRELSAFDSLLNVVPEEDLYYVNFGDPSVFKYFAKQYIELSNRKVIT